MTSLLASDVNFLTTIPEAPGNIIIVRARLDATLTAVMDDTALSSTSNVTKRVASDDIDTPRAKRTQYGESIGLDRYTEAVGAAMSATYISERVPIPAFDTERTNLRNSNAVLQQEKRNLERRLLAQHELNEKLKAHIAHSIDTGLPQKPQALCGQPVQRSPLKTQEPTEHQSEPGIVSQLIKQIKALKQQNEEQLLTETQLRKRHVSRKTECVTLRARVKELKTEVQEAGRLARKEATRESKHDHEKETRASQHKILRLQELCKNVQNQSYEIQQVADKRSKEIQRLQATSRTEKLSMRSLTVGLAGARTEVEEAKEKISKLERELTDREVAGIERTDANQMEIKILRTHNEELATNKRTLERNFRSMQPENATLTKDLAQQKKICADVVKEHTFSTTKTQEQAKKAREDSKAVKELQRMKNKFQVQLHQRDAEIATLKRTPLSQRSDRVNKAVEEAAKANRAREAAEELVTKMYKHYDTVQFNNSIMVGRLEAQAINMGLRDRRSTIRRELDAMKAPPLTNLHEYKEEF